MSRNGKSATNDSVIVFLGPTKCGKSRIIDEIAGINNRGLMSDDMRIIKVSKKDADDIILIDTPELDEKSCVSDMNILSQIETWLKKSYDSNKELAGIVYVYSVSDAGASGKPYKNERRFKSLCRDSSTQRVLLVTTKWGTISEDVALANERIIVSNVWENMVKNGSSSIRFRDNSSSGQEILDFFNKKLKAQKQESISDNASKRQSVGGTWWPKFKFGGRR